MSDKIIGVVCLALSALCKASIRHDDTGMFYAVVFFVVGVHEFWVGDNRQRRESKGTSGKT